MHLLPNTAVQPTGRVLFEGRDLSRLSGAEARHFWGVEMAMVFQDPMTSLNPDEEGRARRSPSRCASTWA